MMKNAQDNNKLIRFQDAVLEKVKMYETKKIVDMYIEVLGSFFILEEKNWNFLILNL